MIWRDLKDKTDAPVFSEAHCGKFRLMVHFERNKHSWFLTVFAGPFRDKKLEASTLEEAKHEATLIFQDCLQKALSELIDEVVCECCGFMVPKERLEKHRQNCAVGPGPEK